jgi:hypothetical protein
MKCSKARLAIVLAAGLMGLNCSHKASDDALANSIKASLFSDQTTKPENIAVAVKDGVVTLSGDVTTADAALEAMKVANGTTGVKSVQDQLTINGAAAATQLPNAGSPQTAATPPPAASSPTPTPSSSSSTPPPAATTPEHSPAPEAAPVAAAPPPPPPPPPKPVIVTIPAGEQVSVRTIDPIDSKVNQSGQAFRATLSSPLVAKGETIIPAGADATILLTEAKSAGKVKGKAELEIELVNVRFRGKEYAVDSTPVTQQGASRGKQTGVRTGIGAAAGALIGGLAGGGKGAAIGAAAGGGAGFSTAFFTKGPKVQIPSESVIAFKLESPLSVQVKP